MLTVCKKAMCALVLVMIAGASLGCLNINKPPDNQPRTEVKVGGDKGVVVDHPGGDTSRPSGD